MHINKIYRKLMPEMLQHKIDIYRNQSQVFWPHFIDTQSLFIHIPKAAGTSVGIALYGRNVGHRKAQYYQDVSKSTFNSLYKFSVVRNPWDRALSAYNFVKNGGTRYVQPTPNSIYSQPVFDSFSSFVENWLPYADLSKSDVVFEPQYKYICDKRDRIIIDFVGKIESIEADMAIIGKEIGKDINLKRLNATRSENTYRDYYTEKTKVIINQIYEKDIEIFEYSF